MVERELMTYTEASHQGAINILGLYLGSSRVIRHHMQSVFDQHSRFKWVSHLSIFAETFNLPNGEKLMFSFDCNSYEDEIQNIKNSM